MRPTFPSYVLRVFLCREMIGAGTPWTSDVTKKWKARMKQTVPDKPDWLMLHKKLLSLEEH